jgi:predicted PurR-regulated permease PerM
MQRRETFATPFLIVALVGVVVLVGTLLWPYATPIAWACVLAAVFHPLYRLMLRGLPGRPSLVAAIMTLAVLGLAVVPALLLTSVVASEALSAYHRAAEYIVQNRVQVVDDFSHHWLVEPVWNWVRENMADSEVDPTNLGLSGLRWLSEFAAANAASVAKNVLGFLVGLGILTFTLFFAFRDGAALMVYLEESLPMQAIDRRRLFDRLQTTLLAVVQGMAMTALLQAVLLGISFWVLGVPFALLLSVIGFAFAFLPVGGSALIWLPVAIGFYIGGDYVRGTALLAWGGIVVSSIDNFVRPLFIGGQAQLPTPLLFFGILGGLQTFGFVGVFAGPAAIAAFLSIVSIYRERLLELRDTPVLSEELPPPVEPAPPFLQE